MTAPSLDLAAADRRALWERIGESLEAFAQDVGELPVARTVTPGEIRERLAGVTFAEPMAPRAAVELLVDGLRRYQVHTPHPRYFGLFNPAPSTLGIAADALVAGFNPQLAAWSHSPFAAEVERHLVRAFGERFGWPADAVEGTFASGGAEANHTALLIALAATFPEFAAAGVRAIAGDPVLYASAEGHHSVTKAARLAGLGTAAVREIAVDRDLRMRGAALEQAIAADRAAGRRPFLVVATAGTTNAGVVDPLAEIADVAGRHDLWFHVDAAWGGAAAMVPELRPVLAGIERAHSITFDAHKWLSVPMGAGVLLTRRPGALERAFRVDNAYMPRDAAALGAVDPYAHSMQWSRRFIGAKVFLSLLVAGWTGYAAVLRHQAAMGDLLRCRLRAAGWEIVNRTELPTVCFRDPELVRGGEEALRAVVQSVVESGSAWVSSTRVGAGELVARACITNYRTQPEDVEALVESLGRARAARLAHI